MAQKNLPKIRFPDEWSFLSDALLIIAEPVTPPTKDGGKPQHTSCRLGDQLLKAKNELSKL